MTLTLFEGLIVYQCMLYFNPYCVLEYITSLIPPFFSEMYRTDLVIKHTTTSSISMYMERYLMLSLEHVRQES